MKRITIRDIAKLVGVNPSTVSRALKDHPDIGKVTKEKINQVAKELGYFPNYQAIHFRQKKSQLIGFIIPEMGRFFAPDLVRAIEEITKKQGYHLIIFQSNELLEKEIECIHLCQRFGVDGLLVAVSRETQNLEHFNTLIQNEVPIVFVDKVLKTNENATVDINDFKATFTAIQHLAKKNYENIAGIFASENLTITQERRAGFEAALAHYQLPLKNEFCLHINQVEDAKERIIHLLQQEDRPDAIFTMSDELLTIVMQVIYQEKLKVPEDIAVISMSNGYLPYYTNPPVTHIKHSAYSVGQTAANLLVDLIEHPKQVLKRQIELETYLVELDSC